MKKLLVLPAAFIIVFIFASCGEDSSTNPPGSSTGNIFVQSTPTGAQIWLDGTNTGKVTPDTVKSVSEGSHNVTLKSTEFRDTTVSVQVTANQTALPTVTLTSSLTIAEFGPVTIFETSGTGVSQPSGLDLSSGNAYGISGSDKDKVDIYYSTDGTGGEPYLVQSANLGSGMTRVTKFKVGTGSNLEDGENSPLQNSGQWTNNMDDREPNYVFLYDNDGHYSKVKITDFHGGTGGNDPSWVEITWYYNQTVDTPNF